MPTAVHALSGAEPVRTCVGCGARAPQRELVRLRVVAGRVEVDLHRAGGRGAWIHAGEGCLARATRRRSFARAFRSAGVQADPRNLLELLTGSPRKD